MASFALGEEGNANATSDALTYDSAEHSGSTSMGIKAPERTIENVLRKARLEGDLIWSFFVSAAKSYRFSSVLHPFPPMFNEDGRAEKLVFPLVMYIFMFCYFFYFSNNSHYFQSYMTDQ